MIAKVSINYLNQVESSLEQKCPGKELPFNATVEQHFNKF